MLSRIGTLMAFGILAAGLGWAARGETRQQTPAIAGVWAFVSETNAETGEVVRDERTWSGIWVFTERHHCLARMEKNRRALSEAEFSRLPAEEKVKYYEQLHHYSSTAGTYRVEGNTLRRQWQVSLGPEIIGQESVATFRVEGDRLTVDLPRRSKDSGPAAQVVYRRVE
jgi:hypothetical protein